MDGFLKEIQQFPQLYYTLFALPRLLCAVLLCGVIGTKREHQNRPAGTKTHILVGVASALIMLTSEFIFARFQGEVNIDPTRLGAQVVSGIGFLGAGTIIKEGSNVKGLTTAAGLWAAAGIGLAAGGGFYGGAIVATAIIYLTLQVIPKHVQHMKNDQVLYIATVEEKQVLGQILQELKKKNLKPASTEASVEEGKVMYTLYFETLDAKSRWALETVCKRVEQIDGVIWIEWE